MNTFDSLVEEVQFQLRYRVPEAIAKAQAMRSLIDFARRTACLSEDGDAVISDESAIIDLSDESRDISAVREITSNKAKLRTDDYLFSEVNQTLQVDHQKGATIRFKKLYVPKRWNGDDAPDLPEAFFSNYGDGIAAHSAVTLSLDPGEPWSSQSKVPGWTATYNRAVRHAVGHNSKVFKIRG